MFRRIHHVMRSNIPRLFQLLLLASVVFLPVYASTKAEPKPPSTATTTTTTTTRWFSPFLQPLTKGPPCSAAAEKKLPKQGDFGGERVSLPPPTQFSSSSCAPSKTTTIVGRLAASFEHVLREDQCFYTEPMLRACKDFVLAMRETGQYGVAKDLERNIAKVERLYQTCQNPLQRQSLSGLLEFESQQGIHGTGGKLKDPSGAMGLLWIRRSLALQHSMFHRLLQNHQSSPTEAALSAYRSTIQPYHGWALRKLHVAAFQRTTPPRGEMLRRIGGYSPETFGPQQEKTTLEDLRRLVSVWEPIIEYCQKAHEELDLEDKRRV